MTSTRDLFAAAKKDRYLKWCSEDGKDEPDRGTKTGFARWTNGDAIEAPDDYRPFISVPWVSSYVDRYWEPDIELKRQTETPLFDHAGVDLPRHFRFPDTGAAGGFRTVHSEHATLGDFCRMVAYRRKAHDKEGEGIAALERLERQFRKTANGDLTVSISTLANRKADEDKKAA